MFQLLTRSIYSIYSFLLEYYYPVPVKSRTEISDLQQSGEDL